MAKIALSTTAMLVVMATCCYAQDMCKGDPTDVIFLVDASMASDDDFRSALTFVENMTSRFAVGVYDTKVALVKFGVRYRRMFSLATYTDRGDVLAAIRNVTRSGGVPGTHSDLGDALSLVNTQLSLPAYGRRLGARLVVVVLTSRTDSIAASVRDNAQALKDKGATIYAIGVGPLIPDAALTTVASDDKRKFAVSGFSDLAALQDPITSDICPLSPASTSAPGVSYTVNDCPPGVPRDKYLQVHAGMCYEFVVYRLKDFWESEKDCMSRGGHLVTIKDQAMNIYILSELEHTYNIRHAVWIGLHDSRTEGKFVWTDGTDAGYLNFGASGGHDTDNDCIAMDPNPNSNAGTWIEYHCIEGTWTKPIQHMYVCQYLPVGSSTHTASAMTVTSTSTPLTPSPSAPVTSTPLTPSPSAPVTSAPLTPSPSAPVTSTPEDLTSTTKTSTTVSTAPSMTSGPTTTLAPATTLCPPFSCDLDCGLDGYKLDAVGCQRCECDA